MNAEQLLPLLPLWYAAFLLSATAHEAAHAAAARWGGDETAYLAGQVSLNPLPHVRREPFGTVLVPLLSFFMSGGGWMMGWASAPYDPNWEDRHPTRAAWMALAGPLANLALALMAFGILSIGLGAAWWVPAAEIGLGRIVEPLDPAAGVLDGLGRLLSIGLTLNLLLFLFNLVPMPPLDGSSVLAGFVPATRSLRDRLRASPLGGMIGIVVAWLLISRLFGPVWVSVVHVLLTG